MRKAYFPAVSRRTLQVKHICCTAIGRAVHLENVSAIGALRWYQRARQQACLAYLGQYFGDLRSFQELCVQPDFEDLPPHVASQTCSLRATRHTKSNAILAADAAHQSAEVELRLCSPC